MAFDLGLVNRLAEPGRAVDEALQLAEAIAANGPLALAATKRIMTESVDWPEAEFFSRQGEISGPVMASEDAREGATAFAEKRPPVWKGRIAARSCPHAVATSIRAHPGRGARTGRCPARCPSARRPCEIGSVSVGPIRSALMCAGMSSSPSSVWVQYGARSGTASLAHDSKSRRTAGEAFSFSASEADVCCDQQVQDADLESAELGQRGQDLARDEMKARVAAARA